MLIPCSEKCIYEEDGICLLKHAIPSSGTPLKDCPYYEERDNKKDEKQR